MPLDIKRIFDSFPSSKHFLPPFETKEILEKEKERLLVAYEMAPQLKEIQNQLNEYVDQYSDYLSRSQYDNPYSTLRVL